METAAYFTAQSALSLGVLLRKTSGAKTGYGGGGKNTPQKMNRAVRLPQGSCIYFR
jgi:hypothetical protein